ncbi:ATP-dependent sacrificial sulfur transferase LarE [Methanothermobacter tenebrarum]
MELQAKIKQVENILKDKKVIIAFSGGSDSTLIAKIASKTSREAIAVTVDTGTLPADVVRNAKHIASKLGIPHKIIKENFLEHEKFKKNTTQRCFHCKDRMYAILESIAEKKGFDIIVDGTNITDMLEDRPGIIANYKRKIRSPLLEAKITKEDVIEYLKKENINYTPNTTCLATRIKGPITTKKLDMISYAENLIKDLTGLELVRVRDFDGIAVIQVDDTSKILDMQLLEYIVEKFKSAGFKSVHVDIEGYHKNKGELIVSREDGEIIFELKLPYPIDLEKTYSKFKDRRGDALRLKIDDSTVRISGDGKIIIEEVKDRKKAERILLEVLSSIKRLEN